ncbi:MAG TPA: HAD-IIIC family phosphatase [Acetobacteraceae bacterium]|jgi:FkbH-like protein
MTPQLFTDLAWLLRPPADFGRRCRSVTEAGDSVGTQIRALASYALDGNQLLRLARTIEAARNAGRSLQPLAPLRLGVIGNGTLDVVAAALVASAARHGIDLTCITVEYGQAMQAALAADSALSRARPDAVLVATDYRAFPLRATPGDRDAANHTVEAWLGNLARIRDGIRKNTGAVCIFQTLAPPPEGLFGHSDRTLPGTTRWLIDAINRGVVEHVMQPGDVLLDVAALAETVGLAEWHSPAQWNMAKLPFADIFVPLYAEHVARVLGALRGKSRKCLVLDLDNTLWGGVIGDDGIEGIRLAQGDAVGEAYLAVQNMALALRQRGIVLAVASKNTDETARGPFRRHPEMLLREDHIAVFQANWTDKASNIKAIAEALSFGLDALVFLDDNPMERDLVRKALPQVAVPELPDDPALYARVLAAAGYFEALGFSDEDRQRADFYRDNARRLQLQEQATDIDAYLASLEMVITFRPFDPTGRARIAQLINKSNQFNLTTRRYTEAEIAELEDDPASFTLQVRLTDTFGDNGMISAVVCKERDDTWEIDTWLMSCRVLGRGVEDMVLRELLHHARLRGMRRLLGVYRPTDRNGMVRDHYAKLGFTQTGQDPNGITRWTLRTDAATREAPMEVRRENLELVAG